MRDPRDPQNAHALGRERSPTRGETRGYVPAPASSRAASGPGLAAPTMPKGGGAVRGIGEKFDVAGVTGTCSSTVPLAISPGRSGFQPAISLSYSSGAGNGPFGIGWGIDVPSITRKTDRKLPQYYDGKHGDTFILSGAEDLVPELEELTPGNWTRKVIDRDGFHIERFRPRTEGLFARVERRRDTSGNVYWVSIDRNNVTSIFGQSAGARVADPADPKRIFSWLLEATYDDRGNVIVYEYKAEDLVNVPFDVHEGSRRDGPGVGAQKYLKRVRYGNVEPVLGNDLTIATLATGITFCFTLLFDYGEHDAAVPTLSESVAWPCRQDPFSTHRSRFEVRTYRLCRRALMFHQFEEFGTEPVLVRSTELTYDEGQSLTYLAAVTQKGFVWNGTSYDSASMPPIEFDYQRPVLSNDVRELDPASRSSLPPVIDGRAHQWVDLDGEGIPGLLSEDPGAWWFRRNLGEGHLSAPRLLPTRPSTASLSASRQQLLSIEGDGTLELAEFDGPAPGYFTRDAEKDSWRDFVPFRTLPHGIDWSDPNVQFIDLNGDGFADILITEGNAIVWYPSRGREGFAASFKVHVGYDDDKGPAVVFSDGEQSIHLADMSGDGLTDLVRIRNGEVCYWPNLGYGQFGAKVTMASAPWFDHRELFDSSRVRLFDVDGSGTADIIYLGGNAITLYRNLSGNRCGVGEVVTTALSTHHLAAISVIDLLGTGTGCLTWFTSLSSEGAPRLRYIDLVDSKKPHVMTKMTNGMGLERLVSYAPSTKFYLEDRAAGVKWATRLPFPVQVVERVEVRDYLAGTRLVSRYRYRHGFYDGREREFRGFAFVEQWDAETVKAASGAGTFPDDLFPEVDGEFVLPPVHTKTWFHTGAWADRERLTTVLRGEYYVGDAQGADLPDTAYALQTLSFDESREAERALKGSILRQEVYADDGTPLAAHPFTVAERCYEVRLLQPRVNDIAHAVFLVHPREELTYNYERASSDPRTQHAVTLEVDDYGVVRKAATIAYPRRVGGESPQEQMLIAVASELVAHMSAETHWYRIGVPTASTAYELTGLAAPSSGAILSFAAVKSAVDGADVIPFDQTPTGTDLELRVVSKRRTIYYENDLSDPLPAGDVESLALLYRQEDLALTSGLLEAVYNDPIETVTPTVLASCGYVADGGDYWARSGRPLYDADEFYQAVGLVDPFGNTSTATFDDYSLLVVRTDSSTTTSSLNNVVLVENDYRVLQPSQLTDPNENRTAFAFDALGLVVKSALMGKDGAAEGDTLANPTTMFEYDLWAFKNSTSPDFAPVVARMRAREQHGGTPTWQDSYVYTDGSGRELLTKKQAAPDGGTPHWIATGRVVYDNKGNPIKQYEPYFSTTSDYESEASIVATGVTAILRYDPLGRVIRTDFPDGSYAKVVFDAWREEAWDRNDTVLDSVWYDEHTATEASPQEQRAASLAGEHANTPKVTHYDSLGRPVIVDEHNGFDGTTPILFRTATTLDISGNALDVEDARGNHPVAQTFDVLSRPVMTTSAESGELRSLLDVAGNFARSWNSRGYAMRTTFDGLRRPTHVYAKKDTDDETLVLRTVYGEELGDVDSVEGNLRGQVYRNYDSAGAETFAARDFKGNLLETVRVFAAGYTATPDWIEIASFTDILDIETEAAALLEGESFTKSKTFDALNRTVTATAPDNSVVTPSYNEANQLVAIEANVRGAVTATAIVDSVTYNPRGQRLEVQYANGTMTEHEYELETFRLKKLVTTRASDDAVLQDLRYWYDPAGNVVEIKDYAQQTVYFSNSVVSAHNKYEYDALYRLIEAEGREHPAHGATKVDHTESPACSLPHPNDTQALRRYVEEYDYDAVGNILELAHTAGTDSWTRWYQYATASNRLTGTSDGGDAQDVPYADTTSYTDDYAHDARGNMTSIPHLDGMDWDHGDRLQHCDLGGGGDSYFVYDAAGQRVRKVWVKPSDHVEDRRYFGEYEVWRSRISGDLDEERQTLHVMDDTRRVAMFETLTVEDADPITSPTSYARFQLDDHLGSSRMETDADGELLTHEEYHPYGTTAFRQSSGASGFAPKRYRYTGKERDNETALYYYGARYYPPWLGRWTAPDPSLKDGFNVYEYCSDNPIRLVDPDGRQAAQPQPLKVDAPAPASSTFPPKPSTTATAPPPAKPPVTLVKPEMRENQPAVPRVGSAPAITPGLGQPQLTKKEDIEATYGDAALRSAYRDAYRELFGVEISDDTLAIVVGQSSIEWGGTAEARMSKGSGFNTGGVTLYVDPTTKDAKSPIASGWQGSPTQRFGVFTDLKAGAKGHLWNLYTGGKLQSAHEGKVDVFLKQLTTGKTYMDDTKIGPDGLTEKDRYIKIFGAAVANARKGIEQENKTNAILRALSEKLIGKPPLL